MVAVLEQCKLVCRPTPQTRGNLVCMVRVRNTFYNQALFNYPQQLLQLVEVPTTPKRQISAIGRVGDFILNFMMAVSILVTILYFLPGLLDRIVPGRIALGGESSVMEETIAAARFSAQDILIVPDEGGQIPSDTSYRVEPEYDLTLPEGRWVMSEAAGIRAPIYTNETVENTKEADEILDKGIYMYPEYNNIGWSGREVILAGHHYNMNVTEQKSAQSFQNLEKLKVGDRVQIADDYKVWTYEIYKIEESTEISEVDPDLMMYTCIYWWDAKTRLFVYGKIVG